MKKILTPYLLTLVCTVVLLPLAGQQAKPVPPAPAPEEQSIMLETITVTGTNIRRVDAEAALPVSVVEPIEIEARGASTMIELFETLGMAEPTTINETNNTPQTARGDVASVDLRGLGSGSTLVLINGRRMAPHGVSMAENGVPSLSPNINAVPRALLSRVEILRDGASAIYGSDAAAGVINNIVSPTFEGGMFRVKGMMTQHGGANEFGITAAEGFKRGKTHFAVTFDYFHRDALAFVDRDWSRQANQRLSRSLPAPFDGMPLLMADGSTYRNNNFDNSNTTNQYGQWQRGLINTTDYITFTGTRPTGNVGITTSTTPPPGVATMSTTGVFFLWPDLANGTINFKQTAPSKNMDSPENAVTSNWNRWRMHLPRTDRFQFATFVDRPLNEKLRLFGDLLFYRARSFNSREPTNYKVTDDVGVYVPMTNPFNPFGVRFYDPAGAPNADGTPRLVGNPADVSLTSTGVSPIGFRPRTTTVDNYAFRTLGGIKGKFGDTWEWESAFMAAGSQAHEYEHYQVRESQLRRALARTDSTAFNPFPCTFKIVNNQIMTDKVYVNPEALINTLYDTEQRYGRTGLYLWDVKANGRLWQLFGGGDIALATGAEVRYETYCDRRPPFSGMNPPGSGSQFPFLRENDNDFLALSTNVPITAQQTIYATYAEMAFPFVTRANRMTLLEALELNVAGRFEHYSIFGQTTKPKASLMYNPFRWLKMRGSVSESFRAPNLVQTSITPLKRQVSATDSYRSSVTSLSSDGSVNRTTYRQGNQNLKPEKAKNWVAGFVLDVPKVRGLSLTFDYFRVKQSNVIENVGLSGTLANDSLLLQQATQAALAAGTPIDKIDLGSGTSGYKGSPFVTRKAVTDDDRTRFATYNAKQTSNSDKRAVVGEYESSIDNYINLSGRQIQGYEIGLQYRMPKRRIGQFTLNAEATHYLLRESQSGPADALVNELERDRRVAWRSSGGLSWRRNAWSAGWFTSYFDSFVSTSASVTKAVYDRLGAPSYIRVFNNNGVTQYLYLVKPFISHNVWVNYNFGRSANRWLRGTSVRLGVNNVFDTEPPISDEVFTSGTTDVRGRRATFEIARTF